jgi:hypothetical protein
MPPIIRDEEEDKGKEDKEEEGEEKDKEGEEEEEGEEEREELVDLEYLYFYRRSTITLPSSRWRDDVSIIIYLFRSSTYFLFRLPLRVK